jgi:hypothetical protein
VSTSPRLPVYTLLAEPELAFHPDRPQDRSPHPLKGLSEFGPFSRSSYLVNDPIRVAAIVPAGKSGWFHSLLAELERKHLPRERVQYLPEFLGFSRIFGVRVLPADHCVLELPGSLETAIVGQPSPHLALAEGLTRALTALEGRRLDYDLVMIFLPAAWSIGFEGGPADDFDLHDYLKAVTASRGVPLQIVREDKALNYPCRCSVMWRLSIAAYCKVGGLPWTLATSEEGSAFVGLSYALAPLGRSNRFVTCCSQVFAAEGSGLEFIAFDTDDVRIDRDNPFLSRAEMRRVMARSLVLYQRRHGGRVPQRLVVHKSTAFTDDEADGAAEALAAVDSVELLQIQQDVPWRGIHVDRPPALGRTQGAAGPYPCHRGSYIPLGEREILLWTQGNAPTAVDGKNYFKEGKGIPAPLVVKRFAGQGGWDLPCQDILGLTKMNWNNDGLYDRLPATLSYAQDLARTVKRMPRLEARPYQFRFFM